MRKTWASPLKGMAGLHEVPAFQQLRALPEPYGIYVWDEVADQLADGEENGRAVSLFSLVGAREQQVCEPRESQLVTHTVILPDGRVPPSSEKAPPCRWSRSAPTRARRSSSGL